MTLRVSRHAETRAKERLGLDKKAAARIAVKALAIGLRPDQTSGDLRCYLDEEISRYRDHGQVYDLRLYAQRVFVFCDSHLVTVFNIPKNLVRLYLKARKSPKVFCPISGIEMGGE